MKYTLEKKMFIYKKYMSLGSPTLCSKSWGGLSMYVVQLQVGQQLWWQQNNLKKLVQSLIYKPKKEKLAKNVKMPKYPRKSHFRETFTIDQKSKPDC